MTRWLPIPGWVGLYEASDGGAIRSVDRVLSSGGRRAGKVLTAEFIDYRARVRLHANGTRTRAGVGALVLTAFVGPCPPGLECCHNNGNPNDNRVENLRWDTHSENVLDQVRHGTHAGAAKTHCLRGHALPPTKKPRAQCPTCRRLNRSRSSAA